MKLAAAIAIALASAGLAAGAPQAHAQAAAESATITATTGSATARGSRSTGSAIGGAMGRAASRIRGRGSAPRSRRATNPDPVVIGTGDALAETDAPIHTVESGATIRVSGRLRPRPAETEPQAELEPVQAAD